MEFDTIVGFMLVGCTTAVVLVVCICLVVIAYRVGDIKVLVDNIEYHLAKKMENMDDER